MNSARLSASHRVETLTDEECFELLASKALGRLAFQQGGPVVLPVNYVVDHDTIVIRTSPHGFLGRHLRVAETAFEVDEIDERSGAGWSVLARGPACPLIGREVSALERRPEPWSDEVQSLYLRISPRVVTGRRYVAPTEPK